jgi:hypothetical protein
MRSADFFPSVRKLSRFFFLPALILSCSCSLMTEPPANSSWLFSDTWGKDYGGASGPGHGDGTSGSAPGAFNAPAKVVVSGADILVLDAGNFRVQKFNSDGVPSIFADQVSAWGNCLGGEGLSAGEFLSPADMVCDASGNIFVSDAEAVRVQVFSSAGTFRTQLCVMKSGAPWPTNTAGGFLRPGALAVDAAGRLYVADPVRKSIDRYTSSFALDSSWGTGGSLQRDSFGKIISMSCDGNSVYLLERTGLRVLSQSDGSETERFSAFGYGIDQLSAASGFCIYEDRFFITDGSTVKVFGPGLEYQSSFCGVTGSKSGEVLMPAGCGVLGNNVFVCDSGNNRIQVFEKRE